MSNIQNEQWLPIDGWSRYEVSNHGRVRRADTMSIRSVSVNDRGYAKTTLGLLREECGDRNKRLKSYSVHRLVAQAFIPNPLGLPQVNHIDGDKLNNNASNLEWCDGKTNMLHAHATGLMPSQKGAGNGNSRITAEMALKVVALRKEGFSLAKITEEIGHISLAAVHLICVGKAWSSVTGIEYKPIRVKKQKPEEQPVFTLALT